MKHYSILTVIASLSALIYLQACSKNASQQNAKPAEQRTMAGQSHAQYDHQWYDEVSGTTHREQWDSVYNDTIIVSIGDGADSITFFFRPNGYKVQPDQPFYKYLYTEGSAQYFSFRKQDVRQTFLLSGDSLYSVYSDIRSGGDFTNQSIRFAGKRTTP